MPIRAICPQCGTGLSDEPSMEGICPHCSLLIALELATDAPTELAEAEPSPEAPTLLAPSDPLSEGQIHGERYRVGSRLGEGGMGEVWRAYDLKLHLDVALKSLRAELVTDHQALQALRQEVRTAPGSSLAQCLPGLRSRRDRGQEWYRWSTSTAPLCRRSSESAALWSSTRRGRSPRSFWPASRPSTRPAWCIVTSSPRT